MATPSPLVPNTRNYLGNYLRKLRLKHGRSLNYIAKKLCISDSYAYFIESGRSVVRDKKLLSAWVRHVSDGKEGPETALKLSMITYPEMYVRVGKLSISDRLRMLALIQEIHLKGMPEEVSKAIDASVIEPNGTVVRMKNKNSNIPEMGKRPLVQQDFNYEDYFIHPQTLDISDAGTLEKAQFQDFLLTPGTEVIGEKSNGAFDTA